MAMDNRFAEVERLLLLPSKAQHLFIPLLVGFAPATPLLEIVSDIKGGPAQSAMMNK